jgi:hypothetical protein
VAHRQCAGGFGRRRVCDRRRAHLDQREGMHCVPGRRPNPPWLGLFTESHLRKRQRYRISPFQTSLRRLRIAGLAGTFDPAQRSLAFPYIARCKPKCPRRRMNRLLWSESGRKRRSCACTGKTAAAMLLSGRRGTLGTQQLLASPLKLARRMPLRTQSIATCIGMQPTIPSNNPQA